jgi:hypothetical protein
LDAVDEGGDLAEGAEMPDLPDLEEIFDPVSLSPAQVASDQAESEYQNAEILHERDGGPAPFDPDPNDGTEPCAQDLNLSDTVQQESEDYQKDGRLSRPYQGSVLTTQNIIAEGNVEPDPGGAPDSVRYSAAGTFRGTSGTYEIVINLRTNTIYHYLFIGK